MEQINFNYLQCMASVVLKTTLIKNKFLLSKNRYGSCRLQVYSNALDKYDSLFFFYKDNIIPKEEFDLLIYKTLNRDLKFKYKHLFRIKNYEIKTYLICG